MSEWQPISTVPHGERVLLWWTPVGGNEYAETVIIGTVYAERPDFYWDGQYTDALGEEGFKPLERITHWTWPPDRPSDRPFSDPAHAEYRKRRRESAEHWAQRREATQGRRPGGQS